MSRPIMIAGIVGVLAVSAINASAERKPVKKNATPDATAAACTIFPADNPWNQDISALPVDPNSGNYIASINRTRQFLHPDFGSDPTYGIPYIVVSGEQQKVDVSFTDSPDESDPGPYPIPLDAPVESGGDAHVIALDKDKCVLYELYDAQPENGGWTAGSGAVFDLRSNKLRPDHWTSAD